jgi:hypothetical protein
MKTDFNFGSTKFGLEGFTGMTPKWAAIASNYLIFATIALYGITLFVNDWSWLIPEQSQELINMVIESLEKTMVSLAGLLRLFGVNNNTPVNNGQEEHH